MITDHVWRPRPHQSGRAAAKCAYMNCSKPRDAHERGVQDRGRP